MRKESRSYVATQPGLVLAEYLQIHNIMQKEFAARLGISEKHLCNFLDGNVILTSEMAYKLEKITGISGTIWVNLEYEYRKELQLVIEENNMDEDIEILKNFPIKKMEEFGMIPTSNNNVDKVKNLRSFFNVIKLTYLFDQRLPIILGCNERTTTKTEYNLMVLAQYAKFKSNDVKVEKININKLSKSLNLIKSIKKENEKDYIEKLTQIFSSFGIVLVILPPISKSTNGITFTNNDKIVLSVVLNEKFWHSLFHEIGHIVLGHLKEKKEKNKEAEEFANNMLK